MHVSWMSGRGRGVIQNQVFFFFFLSLLTISGEEMIPSQVLMRNTKQLSN